MIVNVWTLEQQRLRRVSRREKSSSKLTATAARAKSARVSVPFQGATRALNFPMDSAEMLARIDDDDNGARVLMTPPMLWAARWWTQGGLISEPPRGTDAEVRELVGFFQMDVSLLKAFGESELGKHFKAFEVLGAPGGNHTALVRGLAAFCDAFFEDAKGRVWEIVSRCVDAAVALGGLGPAMVDMWEMAKKELVKLMEQEPAQLVLKMDSVVHEKLCELNMTLVQMFEKKRRVARFDDDALDRDGLMRSDIFIRIEMLRLLMDYFIQPLMAGNNDEVLTEQDVRVWMTADTLKNYLHLCHMWQGDDKRRKGRYNPDDEYFNDDDDFGAGYNHNDLGAGYNNDLGSGYSNDLGSGLATPPLEEIMARAADDDAAALVYSVTSPSYAPTSPSYSPATP